MDIESKKVTVLHYSHKPTEPEIITLLGQPVEITHVDCQGDFSQLIDHIKRVDELGEADAIALNGVSKTLRIGNRSMPHTLSAKLFSDLVKTPMLDGSTLSPAIERWSVRLAHNNEPGIWAHKRVLMAPSLNHTGLSEALGHHADHLQTADHLIFGAAPAASSGSILADRRAAPKDDRALLEKLTNLPFEKIFSLEPQSQPAGASDPIAKLFDWADVVAGDATTICRFAPSSLQRKTVVVSAIQDSQVAMLLARGVSIIVTLLPNLSYDKHQLARHSSATLEACLTAVSGKDSVLSESDFLNLIAELEWQPTIRYLQPADVSVNRFGFITQPNSVTEIRENVRLARFLPEAFIHRTAVHIPPVFHGRMENIQTEGSRKKATCEIMMLGGTPEEFTAQESELVAHRILRAASMAEQLEARLIGSDTASREVSDAISAIASKTNVPICTGQAMTIYGALVSGIEIAEANSVRSGSLLKGTIVGATDPVVAVAAEVLASYISDLTLIGSEPDLLIQLKRKIEDIHPNTKVTVATDPNQTIRQSDLLVLGRNAAGKRLTFNPAICNPGAVICDFSQPSVISADLLSGRPDLTLIESAIFEFPKLPERKIYRSLPSGAVPAAFAEAILLAIQGNFVDYGLAGQLNSKHVYDMRDLAMTRHVQRAGVIAHGIKVPQAQIEARSAMARNYAAYLAKRQNEPVGEVIFTEQPARPSIRRFAREHSTVVVTGVGVLAVLASVLGWLFSKRGKTNDSI